MEIMDQALVDLQPWSVKISVLRHSYRTTQIVLDAVNLIFKELYAGFPS